MAIPALAIACLSMAQPAASECLSPSAEVGATATTVYRCPEAAEPSAQQPATAKQPLAPQEKSTVVERGSADVPWFEPPAKQDPIKTAKTPQVTDEAVAPKTTAAKIKPAEPTKATATEDEAAVAAPEPEQPKITKKAKAKKKVIATKRKIKKAKVATSKKPKAKTKAKTIEPTTAKIESKPPDEKTIVWTKKDMPIGSRIVNWLGF